MFVMQAMKVVSDRQMLEATEKQMKETELSRVKINREDIDLIVSSENWSNMCRNAHKSQTHTQMYAKCLSIPWLN